MVDFFLSIVFVPLENIIVYVKHGQTKKKKRQILKNKFSYKNKIPLKFPQPAKINIDPLQFLGAVKKFD